MTMQDNIQQMLANEERLDQISENAENLNEQVSGWQGRSLSPSRCCIVLRVCVYIHTAVSASSGSRMQRGAPHPQQRSSVRRFCSLKQRSYRPPRIGGDVSRQKCFGTRDVLVLDPCGGPSQACGPTIFLCILVLQMAILLDTNRKNTVRSQIVLWCHT